MAGYIERFNPGVVELKKRIEQGEAGRLIQIQARRVGPFFPRERDVGVVHDLATHDIDVMRHLLGCEVERARAETQRGVRTEFEDALLGLLRFENGVIGSLEVNWLTPVKQRTLAVVGENGMFVADYIRQELRFSDSGPDPDPSPPKDAANVTAIDVERQEPLRVELAAFLRTARGLEPPLVGAADAIAAMRVAEALVESARLGSAVQLGIGEAER
ncbi:MAG: Gfo/Idh/MocA family oxidoreductase [Chloroflexi bacterium]|nr:Gfo/Idh/MocA family oxidoreductase [Chloroflexota bacterium]